MSFIALGFILIVLAVLLLDFHKLNNALRQFDEQQWNVLGCPQNFAFHKSLGVFSWVLSKGYQHSHHSQVIRLGSEGYKRAIAAKYMFLTGTVCLLSGFIIAIYQAFP